MNLELVSVAVESFGCLDHRAFQLQPGLNVVHGPNEAGKSTVARAIRFALLLPPNAAAAAECVPWSGTGQPTVTLTFRTDPSRYWRVRKVFGTTSAALEKSSDGTAWAIEARSREVESRLRSLLGWGVPEPGGATRMRGVPESFLAQALLADQQEVDGILAGDLSTDTTDSGRERVRAALQAVANDPLFRSILLQAQARADEAFDSVGKPRRGAGAPFKKAAEAVKTIQEDRDAAVLSAERSRSLAQGLEVLRASAVEAEEALHEATAKRSQLADALQRQRAFEAARRAREDAETRLSALAEAERACEAAKQRLREVEPTIGGLRLAEEAAHRAYEAATAGAAAVREKRKTELAQEEASLDRERQGLAGRRRAVEAEAQRAAAERGEADVARLDEELCLLDLVEPWRRLSASREALKAAQARERDVASAVAQAAAARAQVPDGLPDAARLAALQALRNDLEVAERQLDVGLSISVEGAPAARIALDGAKTVPMTPPFAVEARGTAVITLGTAEVVVRGGRPDARARAEKLRGQWHDESAELFRKHAVDDLPALEAKRRDADTLLGQIQILDAKRDALGDPSSETRRHEIDLAALEAQLAGADLDAVEAAAPTASEVNRKRAQRTNMLEAALRARAEEKALRASLVEAATGPEDPAAIESEAKALDARERALREAKAALALPAEDAGALAAVAAQAKAALDQALEAVSEAKESRAQWQARLEERRAAAAGIDLAGLRAAETAARVDGPHVDQAALDASVKAEEGARETHRDLGAKVQRAEGELRASGGAAAAERLRDLEEALDRAQKRQARVEDDFEAWRLLKEALEEAEKAQATHLGNALAPDLEARFRDLVGERFDGVALGPHLTLEGVDAAGARRTADKLSVGTREQLATVFRLCLAERLQSAVVLDDQLVQSDPARLRWFRRALRETAARNVQIVVLTCRPDDYLELGETPGPHVVELGSS